jgi:hypothetical protein
MELAFGGLKDFLGRNIKHMQVLDVMAYLSKTQE